MLTKITLKTQVIKESIFNARDEKMLVSMFEIEVLSQVLE